MTQRLIFGLMLKYRPTFSYESQGSFNRFSKPKLTVAVVDKLSSIRIHAVSIGTCMRLPKYPNYLMAAFNLDGKFKLLQNNVYNKSDLIE